MVKYLQLIGGRHSIMTLLVAAILLRHRYYQTKVCGHSKQTEHFHLLLLW